MALGDSEPAKWPKSNKCRAVTAKDVSTQSPVHAHMHLSLLTNGLLANEILLRAECYSPAIAPAQLRSQC